MFGFFAACILRYFAACMLRSLRMHFHYYTLVNTLPSPTLYKKKSRVRAASQICSYLLLPLLIPAAFAAAHEAMILAGGSIISETGSSSMNDLGQVRLPGSLFYSICLHSEGESVCFDDDGFSDPPTYP